MSRLYDFCRPIVGIYYRLFFKLDIQGIENVPKESGAIICPNHASNHDPIVIAYTTPRQVRFMAKAELFKTKILAWFLNSIGTFPVKRGEPDLNAVKTTLKILKDDGLIGLFPEGTRVKTGDLGTAHSGVALFAIKTGKPVVPVYIGGSFKPFTKIKVVYGKPIYFDSYKKPKMLNEDYLELSQMVIEEIRKLREVAICGDSGC